MFNVAIHIVTPEKKNVMTHNKLFQLFYYQFQFTDVHVLLKISLK